MRNDSVSLSRNQGSSRSQEGMANKRVVGPSGQGQEEVASKRKRSDPLLPSPSSPSGFVSLSPPKEKHYRCLFCLENHSSTFSNPNQLQDHLKDTHGLAGKLIPSDSFLKRMWTIHQRGIISKCWICLKSFHSFGLESHIKGKHKDVEQEQDGDNPDGGDKIVPMRNLICQDSGSARKIMSSRDKPDGGTVVPPLPSPSPSPPSPVAVATATVTVTNGDQKNHFSKKIPCIFCPSNMSTYSRLPTLRNHLRKVHHLTDRLIPCGNTLRSWSLEMESFVLKCWVCSSSSNNSCHAYPLSLLNHLQTEHLNDTQSLNVSPDIFISSTTFPSAGIKCIFCNGSFSKPYFQLYELKKHLKAFHYLRKERLIPSGDTLRSWVFGKSQSVYNCWICSEGFDSPEALLGHILDTHDNDKEDMPRQLADNFLPKNSSSTPSKDQRNNNSFSSGNTSINYNRFFCMGCSLFFEKREVFDNHSCNVKKENENDNDKVTVKEEEEEIYFYRNGIFPD